MIGDSLVDALAFMAFLVVAQIPVEVVVEQNLESCEEKDPGPAADVGDCELLQFDRAPFGQQRAKRAIRDDFGNVVGRRDDTAAITHFRLVDDFDPVSVDLDDVAEELLVDLAEDLWLHDREGVRTGRIVQLSDDRSERRVADANIEVFVVDEPKQAAVVERIGTSELFHQRIEGGVAVQLAERLVSLDVAVFANAQEDDSRQEELNHIGQFVGRQPPLCSDGCLRPSALASRVPAAGRCRRIGRLRRGWHRLRTAGRTRRNTWTPGKAAARVRRSARRIRHT